jgi:hypothetical protein
MGNNFMGAEFSTITTIHTYYWFIFFRVPEDCIENTPLHAIPTPNTFIGM